VLVWLCFAVPLEGRSVGPVLSLLIVVAVLAGTVIAQRGPFVEERLERVLRLATVASLWAVGIVLVGVAVGKVTGIGA